MRLIGVEMRAASACIAAAVLTAAPMAAAQVTIGDLAPREAVLVASVDNFKQAKAALERSGLMELWRDERLQNWVAKSATSMTQDFEDLLNELELDKEDLVAPSGAVGAAMWFTASDDSPMGEPQFFVVADFEDEADKAHDALQAVIDRALEEDQIELDEEEYANHTIFIVKAAPGAADEADDPWAEFENGGGFLDDQALHYVRHEGHLLASTSMNALADALDRLGGDDIDSAGDNPALAETLAQVGDHQAFAAFLARPLFDQMKKAEADGAMAGGPGMAMFEALGLTEVRAASFGLNLASTAGVVEGRFGVLAPEKRGLVALFDVEPVRFEPPAWVPADAATVSVFQVNFSEILPTLKKAFGAMGEEGEMMLGMVGQAEGFVAPILANMGTTLISASVIDRPYKADSERSVMGIALKDAKAFVEALQNSPIGGMAEAREFQGSTIWSLEGMGMGGPVQAMGVGGGHLFVGATDGVEDALRQVGGGGGLGKEPGFQNAMRPMSNRGLGYSWTSLRKMLEWSQWQMDNRRAIFEQEAKQMYGDDPEFADWRKQIVDQRMEEIPDWQKDMPDLKMMLDHLGDVVTEFRATDEGFRGRMLVLKPAG